MLPNNVQGIEKVNIFDVPVNYRFFMDRFSKALPSLKTDMAFF